ncbi:TRAFAC clade GTPase domain-containing protein, partial [Pseudomonas coronafaciens]|uniref:TRAFAC clade GTPase domain-containing protein n=1 Tax=Pseudomonas coronafaciens TaxID=53409 RepID=UPI00399F4085
MADDNGGLASVTCANPECRVAETGRCVEGLVVDACSHYGAEADDQGDGNPDVIEVELEDEGVYGVSLPHAESLDLEEGSQALRASNARVIAVIGPSDSGKTSLIAGLYDLFQSGLVGKVKFARSKTLHAFERLCHDARAVSSVLFA